MKNEWMDQAACLGEDLNMFFPDTPNNHARAAKAICETCPVVDECLQWALDNNEQGVWGGLTDNQRKNLRRKLGMKPKRVDAICGTAAGARAHYRDLEVPCAPCRRAAAEERKRWRETARLKAL